MNDDAMNPASPRWVRLSRTAFCFAVAAAVSWRGIIYDDPNVSTAVPFFMCQLTGFTVTLIGLLNLASCNEIGPS
jgi:hypothetical protein